MRNMSIREIHIIELDILKKLHSVCENLGIIYYLAYGSLIGAVRHKGFIPWDDDLDVMMFREDMEILLDYFKKNEEDLKPYKILTLQNCPDYPYAIPRLCNMDYKVKHHNKKDCGMGIFIDIYPIDSMGDELETGEKDYRKINKLVKLSYIATDMKYSGASNIIKSIVKYPVYLYAKKVGISSLYNKILAVASKYFKTNSRYVGVAVWGSVPNKFERSWFGNGTLVPFENMMTIVPADYDSILKSCYGDYMKLPPEDKRHSTHDYDAYKLK